MPVGEMKLAKRDYLLLGALLALYSYHHKYCWPASAPAIFLAVHLASLAALAVVAAKRIVRA